MVDLPLFPLNTVLFPGGTLPLHIFEERYKQMMAECVEKETPFGVVLIRSGQEVGGSAEPYDIGTSARISRVQQLEGGRLNLVAVGVDRFRIVAITESTPFLRGEVQILRDTDSDDPQTMTGAETVSGLYVDYFRLALALTGQWQDRVGVPQEPRALADFVATRLETDAGVKQRLLETLSVVDRLSLEGDLLKQAVDGLVEQFNAAKRMRYGGLGALN